MMQNVIAFPKKAVEPTVCKTAGGSKTLFLHIRQTTLIVHLAAQTVATANGNRVGSKA